MVEQMKNLNIEIETIKKNQTEIEIPEINTYITWMSQSFGADITKYHRLVAYKQQKCIVHSWDTGKPKIKAWEDAVFGEGPLSDS